MKTMTLRIRLGRRTMREVDVASFEEASAIWSKRRDDAIWRGACANRETAEIYRGGRIVAHVSYNGCVWAGTEGDWKSGAEPIYDPRPVAREAS